MKKPLHLTQRLRFLFGAAVLCFGFVCSWIILGPDEMGLLLMLPFAGFFAWICPELWRGE